MKPTVSVVLPVFNGGRTIRQAIDSVLAQTFDDLELLIWNDGSTDDTLSVVSSYQDPRIVLLGGSENSGAGRARDAAINVARGKWLALIDADDVWLPFRLEKLISFAGESVDSMIFDDLMLCHDAETGMIPWKRLRGPNAFNGDGVHPVTVPPEKYLVADRYLIHPMIPMDWILAIKAKHGPQRFGEDAYFYLQLIAAGLGLTYYPAAMYLYRYTPGSLSSFRDRDVQMLGVLRDVEPLFASSEIIHEALKYKIEKVQRSVRYTEILSRLRQRRILSWIGAVVSNPWFIPMFFQKAFDDLQAMIHRSLHGVRKRDSQ